MTLRWKLLLYLLFVHLVFAGAAVFFFRQNRIWLLAVEAFFLISGVCAFALVRRIFRPIDQIRAGVQFIRESDFTSRFRQVGQPEVDELTSVYNQMVDHLREERIKVREQHHFLDKIISASPSAIVIFDFDSRISMANPAAERMLGTPAATLAGRKLEELATPFAQALAALGTGESKVLPLEGIRRVKCQKSQFLDRGFPRSFLMIEELTEELRRSERSAYEKIIRLMSHEINNSVGASNSILHSCLNYKDQLREDDRADFETALNVAISRASHLNAFVKSYADVIRLPAPDMRPCDVKRLLEDIVFLMSAECRERRTSVCWEIQGPLEPVSMDKNQMEQVFLNILRNSLEAIGAGGTITIRLGTNQAGRAHVAIEDTGCGIPPEVENSLFTPFFSTKENGRGIGLTLVQEILTRHHFRFSLDSKPGGPTQFRVTF